MNTIIYIYRGRDNANFKIEKLDEPDYCLIRLGLPLSLWKHLKQLDRERQDEPKEKQESEQEKQESAQGSAEKRTGRRNRPERKKSGGLRWKGNSLWKCRRAIGRNISRNASEEAANSLADADCGKAQEGLAMSVQSEAAGQEMLRQEAQKQEALRKEALRQQVAELLGELESLQTALCLLGGNTYWTYTVYEERLRTKVDTFSWWDAWKIPEFDDYRQPLWAEKLLPHGDCPNLLVLGQSDCIPGLLVANARRLRSVKWYLLKNEYTQEAEVFLDGFYDEYGLVVELHLLEEKKDWWSVRFYCPEPVKVLDFTGEPKVSAYEVAKGSIWLDMDALDEKSERMEVRNQGIRYFSLKKLWAQPQKASNTLTPM